MTDDLVFHGAMEQFMEAPEACTRPGNAILNSLIRGWGNQGYSALEDYLMVCISHALTSEGPILECGSGLTTILAGAIAHIRGVGYWALEHKAKWARKVRTCLALYRMDTVVLCDPPLKDYGEFAWYDPPVSSMPGNFSLVICDGPPGRTKGGRIGLVPVMKERLKHECVILLDDADRKTEQKILKSWETELGACAQHFGSTRSHAPLSVSPR